MELQDRVERLEKQNRWLKLAVICLTLVGSTVGLMGAKANRAETVRASRFELIDGDDKVRAVLKCEENVAVLEFFTAKGDAGTHLREDGLTLCDPHAKPVAGAHILPSSIVLNPSSHYLYMYGTNGTDIELKGWKGHTKEAASIRLIKDIGKEKTERTMTMWLNGDKPLIEVNDHERKILNRISP